MSFNNKLQKLLLIKIYYSSIFALLAVGIFKIFKKLGNAFKTMYYGIKMIFKSVF